MKFVCFLVLLLGAFSVALPVSKTKKDESPLESSTTGIPDVETVLEYERYLKEVVEALESDPDFRKKLHKAPEADIRSGKIALELDFVNHNVRSKLDESKRREIDRLRSLGRKVFDLSNRIDQDHPENPEHLDHQNEHTFEIEDLRKLILKTSHDLAEVDRMRHAEFKEYEMQKEFERENKLREMDETHRKEYEQELKSQTEKHKQHEKVHHPGNKVQLEEVWEKQDHMEKEDFDPHTFFMIHDVDSNGYWDEDEVKALFVKELDKVYQSGLPEDDMRERAEEMELMREHVFKETDTNNDGLISFQEFLEQTKREEFKKDPEWKTVDEQPQYTHEEYLEFEKRRQEEINRMISQGLLPPHPNMPQGYYPNEIHGAYQTGDVQQNHYQQKPQAHYQQPNQLDFQNQKHQTQQHPVQINLNQPQQHDAQYQQQAPQQPLVYQPELNVQKTQIYQQQQEKLNSLNYKTNQEQQKKHFPTPMATKK